MGSWSGNVPASRDLGFNALGFGWPTLWKGPQAAAALAKRVGLKLQIEPFRFWRIADIKRLPADQVIAFEGRWTDHTLLQTAQRVWREKTPPTFVAARGFSKFRQQPAVCRGSGQTIPQGLADRCVVSGTQLGGNLSIEYAAAHGISGTAARRRLRYLSCAPIRDVGEWHA